MPNFFQTMMGKTFFEGQLPKAINALVAISSELKRIADALEEQNSLDKSIVQIEKEVAEDVTLFLNPKRDD